MPKRATKTTLPPMTLDRTARVPLHKQVYAGLRREILEVRIAPGDRLPSTRSLASALGVSRNTVALAYEQLLSEGFVITQVGSGTRAARASVATFLRNVPLIAKDALALRGKLFQHVVLEALYPCETSSFTDPSGNALFLFSAGA